MEKIVQSGAS